MYPCSEASIRLIQAHHCQHCDILPISRVIKFPSAEEAKQEFPEYVNGFVYMETGGEEI